MINTLMFDSYGTLFDVHSVQEVFESEFPGKGKKLSRTWREKQTAYFFQSQLTQTYRPLDVLTIEALRSTCEAGKVKLTIETEQKLWEAYLALRPFPETEGVLKQIKGFQKVILSNGTPNMLAALLDHQGWNHLFDHVISANEAKQYKPSPAAYQYAMDWLGLERSNVMFLSSNPWDIDGAKRFGFRTAWINRNGEELDRPFAKPDYELRDLTSLLEVMDG